MISWAERQARDLLGWLMLLASSAFIAFAVVSAVGADRPHLSRSVERDSIVAQAARDVGVPPALAVAVSHVENWTGDSLAISPRGAVGLMQVLPRFWAHTFDLDCGAAPLLARAKNACVGVHVLAYEFQRFGTWGPALRAYGGGTTRYSDAVLDYFIQGAK